MVTIVAGFAFLHDERFQGRSAPLHGTPVTLRVERGVAADRLAPIRTGIRAADRYMRRKLGGAVHDPVEARVAGASGCDLLRVSDGIPVGEAELGRLCIDTASLAWQWLVLQDRVGAEAVAAHEYAHVLQAELGCLPAGPSEEPRWLVEGMVIQISWRALVEAGLATARHVDAEIARGGAFDTNLEPLRRYETEPGRDPEYSLWHLATRALLREAVLRGAAPRARPTAALMSWCRRVGDGVPWRLAFGRSFGLTPQRFYARFEWGRLRGMLERRIVTPAVKG